MSCKLDPATVARIPEVLARHGGNQTRAAEELGVHRRTIGRYSEERYPISVFGPPGPDKDDPPETLKRDEKGDDCLLSFETSTPIKTLDDAIRHAEVDLSTWRVDRWESSAWTVPMKLRDSSKERPVALQMFRVKLYLKRVLPKPFLEASAAIFERLAKHAPKYPAVKSRPPADPHLLEVSLFDVHIGKLAWAPETGSHYDLRIAEQVFRNAVEELAGYASPFEIDSILLPIGNDFFHIDNQQGTTSAGTPQDSDGRYAKIIEVGELAVFWAVEHLSAIAPVTVLWVPGNHDRVASYHLCRTLAAGFRNSSRVTVDVSPSSRKYHKYGQNLIGFTHGCDERPASLPTIMATECSGWWGMTDHREWHVGHRHQSKATETTPVNTHDGVVVRTLRSLSGTDAWHYSKGYVGTTRAAEAFLWRRSGGMAANFIALAKDKA